MSNIVLFEQQMMLVKVFVQFGLFGVKNEVQVFVLMVFCEVEGMYFVCVI